jgi:RNA polymerase sigma-70 factor (ECF subfamily)
MKDDVSLSSRLAADLDGHFEQLVRTFQDRLYGFTLRLVGSRQDAEECTQDAFVRAYQALEQYPAERRAALHLRPWLYQIALNVVRNRVRRPALPQVDVDGPIGNGLAGHSSERPEAVVLRQERIDRLATAVGELPWRYRTAVVLRHVHELSYAEAAAVLEQPVGTTKSDVHRGLRLLRDRLAPELLVEARNA